MKLKGPWCARTDRLGKANTFDTAGASFQCGSLAPFPVHSALCCTQNPLAQDSLQ